MSENGKWLVETQHLVRIRDECGRPEMSYSDRCGELSPKAPRQRQITSYILELDQQ